METIWNITFKFLDFLSWLLLQGTWGVIASLVIWGAIVYLVVRFTTWLTKYNPGTEFRFFK